MASTLDRDGQTGAPGRLLALDGARGLSALMVAFFHLDKNVWPAHGYLAVDLFFLLSGYVIAGAYEERLRRGAGFGWFFGVRMARLYPIYLFGTLVGLVCALASHPWAAVSVPLLRAVVFLPGPASADFPAYPLNGVMWTLVAEIEINLLYALFGHRLSTKTLAVIAAIAGALLAAQVAHRGWANIGSPLRAVFAFPLGVVIWRLHRAGRLPRLSLSVATPAGAAAVVYGAPLLPSILANGVMDSALILVAIPLVFLGLVLARPPTGRAAWVCAYAGGLSYALYAVHLPIGELLLASPLGRGGTLGHVLPLIVGLGVAIPLAVFGHHVVEPAGRRLILSWLNARRPTVAAEPAVPAPT